MKRTDKYKTKKILKPGKPGTKKYEREFGDKLIYIRHKYNEFQNKKIVTVEIVVDTNDWYPDSKRIPHNKIMNIHVGYNEKHIRKMIKEAGAKWNPKKQVWQLPYNQIDALGLTGRIRSP